MIPEKMKAVVVNGEKSAAVCEVSTPIPQPGEVLVRLDTCLLCTWEQRIFSRSSSMPLPYIPGHEAAGTIASIPTETLTSFAEGDRVVIKTLNHCGHCEACYRGDDNQCTGSAKSRIYDGIPAAGGLAQYIAMPISRVFPIDGDLPLEEAAFAEPIACCIRSMERADIQLGEDVVIVGAGIMGQLHNLLAKMRGARTILVEPDAERRALALRMGADIAIDPLIEDPYAALKRITNGRGVHVVFVTTAMTKLAQEYIAVLSKTGRIVYYGSFHPDGDIAINPNKIHYSETVITGSYSPNTRGFWTASRLLSSKLIDVKPFLSAKYPIEECQDAFLSSLSPKTYRVAIKL